MSATSASGWQILPELRRVSVELVGSNQAEACSRVGRMGRWARSGPDLGLGGRALPPARRLVQSPTSASRGALAILLSERRSKHYFNAISITADG